MRAALPLVFLATAAPADGLNIMFRDGSPGDMFHVHNTGCPVTDATLTFDLTTSVGEVVIDTEYGGRGTQDPMPAQLIEGDAVLAPVIDGTQTVTLQIASLPTGAGLVVVFDADDSTSAAHSDRVHVEGAEIAGATATLARDDIRAGAAFDTLGNATLLPPFDLAPCLSS